MKRETLLFWLLIFLVVFTVVETIQLVSILNGISVTTGLQVAQTGSGSGMVGGC